MERPSMFELVSEYHRLIDYGCPEIDEKDTSEIIIEKKAEIEAFEGTMQMLLECIDDKADTYCAVLSHIEARSKMLKAEIDKMTALKKAEDNAIKRMKEALVMAMNETGRTEIRTDLHTLKVVNNGGKQALDVDKDNVPQEYTKTTVIIEPDNDKIRSDIESGKELSFARLKPRGQRLSIK